VVVAKEDLVLMLLLEQQIEVEVVEGHHLRVILEVVEKVLL
jgi:hypothetical protein